MTGEEPPTAAWGPMPAELPVIPITGTREGSLWAYLVFMFIPCMLALTLLFLVGVLGVWDGEPESVPMPRECRGYVVCVIDETGAHPK